jgi:tetratricopeptide (TPR) repeat protein
LKKVLSFLMFILICAGSAFLLFTHPTFFRRQCHKVEAFYYVYRGDKAYKQWKLGKAIKYYNRALNLYPEHYTAWTNLGNIYVVYEDYYSAADAYEQAILYNPKYTVARMNYGIISTEELGDFDGAISQYRKILEIRRHQLWIPFVYNNKRSSKSNIGLAYYNMGVAYKQKSLYTDASWEIKRIYMLNALDSYQHAAKILKRDYDTRYNLALTQQLLGDYHDAGLNYCKAIALSPMNYEAHYNLAILLKHLKYYDESLEELEKATSLVTNSEGASDRQRYIFDVMNDVTHTILSQQEDSHNTLIETLGNPSAIANSGLTFVDGKLVKTDDLDKAILQNFKACKSKSIFKEDITSDYTENDDETPHSNVNLP